MEKGVLIKQVRVRGRESIVLSSTFDGREKKVKTFTKWNKYWNNGTYQVCIKQICSIEG